MLGDLIGCAIAATANICGFRPYIANWRMTVGGKSAPYYHRGRQLLAPTGNVERHEHTRRSM